MNGEQDQVMMLQKKILLELEPCNKVKRRV